MISRNKNNDVFENKSEARRQRFGIAAANIIFYISLPSALVMAYLAVTMHQWQVYLLVAANLIILTLASIGRIEIQKGNRLRGSLLVFTGVHLVLASLPLLLTDISATAGIIGLLIVPFSAWQTFESKVARRIIYASVAASLLTILFGVLPISFRIITPTAIFIDAGTAIGILLLSISIYVWSEFRDYGLQAKLIVTFITLLVLSLLITGGYSLLTNLGAQQSKETADLQDDMLAKRTAVDRFMEAAEEDTIFLSQAEVLRNYINTVASVPTQNIITSSRTQVEREFRYFAENRQIYSEIRFLDLAGQELIKIVTSPEGKASIIAKSELLTINDPVYFRERAYFSQGISLRANQVYISPLDLSVKQGQLEVPYKPVIRIATPVIVNTQKKGIIIVTVYADRLFNQLSLTGADTFLVDKDGYYLFSPDQSKRWGLDLGTGIKIGQDFPDLASNLFSGRLGSQTSNGNLITYSPVTIPGESEPRWFIGTYVSSATVARPIINSTFTTLAILLLTLVASIIAMTYLGRAIVRPIESLAQVAQQITEGNLTVKAEVQTADEVGVLARVFNDMTGQLRELVTGLESRVAERTDELKVQQQQSEYRAKQYEAITKVARAINTTQNLKELLPQISKVISEQFGFYHVGIFLNDSANEVTLLSAANSEGGQRMLARKHQLKIGEQGIVGYVTATGRPRIALNVGDDMVFFNNPDLPETHSEMALPLKIGDVTIGALDVQSREPNAFSGDDVDLLSTLADQVSLAIQNARLFDQTRKALADSEAISRQYLREAWDRLPEDNKLAGFRYTSSGAEAIERDSKTNGNENPISDDRQFIEVPIQLRGQTIGKLKVQVASPGDIKGTQLDLIKAVAERVALSAENARLFEETTRRAERERRVSDITTKIRSVNDPEEMISTAIEELRKALGATRVEVVPQRLSDMTDK